MHASCNRENSASRLWVVACGLHPQNTPSQQTQPHEKVEMDDIVDLAGSSGELLSCEKQGLERFQSGWSVVRGVAC
jgi:hypothetical protein